MKKYIALNIFWCLPTFGTSLFFLNILIPSYDPLLITAKIVVSLYIFFVKVAHTSKQEYSNERIKTLEDKIEELSKK